MKVQSSFAGLPNTSRPVWIGLSITFFLIGFLWSRNYTQAFLAEALNVSAFLILLWQYLRLWQRSQETKAEVADLTAERKLASSFEVRLEAKTHELTEAMKLAKRDAMSRALVSSQLEVERLRLETILQQIPAGIIIADSHSGKIILTNGLARDVFRRAGIDLADIKDENWPLAQALQARETILGELVELPDGEGQLVSLRLSVVPIVNTQGQAVARAATFFDVTKDLQKEKELIKAKFEAEEASRAKTAFLANCSHEIRTPLNAIIGFVDLMREDDNLTPEQEEALSIVSRNGLGLAQIINDILDISKIEAGHLEVVFEQIHVRTLVDEVISLLDLKAREKGIKLTVDYQVSHDFIVSDAGRLRQILLNVVGNAIKFTKVGRVMVSVIQMEDGNLDIRVRDTGIGIPLDMRDRLFRVFSQVNEGSSREYGGTGLGLALSRRLAQALGGDISLTASMVSEGSTFTIRIPTQAPPVGEPAQKTSERSHWSDHRIGGIRVLVAEDSPDNQNYLKKILKRAGAVVDIVDNGLAAIEKVDSQDYDIVLMDIQMPVLNGYDATRTLRERGYVKPIVALTAHALKDERERSLGNGCNEHLTKPISPTRLAPPDDRSHP